MTHKLQAGSAHANHRFREPNGRPADNSRIDALLEVRGHGSRVAAGRGHVNHGGSSEKRGKALRSLNPAFMNPPASKVTKVQLRTRTHGLLVGPLVGTQWPARVRRGKAGRTSMFANVNIEHWTDILVTVGLKVVGAIIVWIV